MQPISQPLLNLLDNPVDLREYRPPRWESPIELTLWEALRYIGISVETQISIGDFRVDMLVSSRRNHTQALIECDGAEFHHRIIDEFRDDEIFDLVNVPIAHVFGKEIVQSPEKCAIFITERWFPEHIDSLGYRCAYEIAYKEGEAHVSGRYGFFPVGYARDAYVDPNCMSYTDPNFRSYVRWLAGNKSDYDFANDSIRKEQTALKVELHEKGILEQRLSPQRLARLYILLYPFPDEAVRNSELENLENFLERLKNTLL